MKHVEFYILDQVDGKPIPGCGDRSVIRLDGRQSRVTHHLIAERVCRERGYVGYRLRSGDSILYSRFVSDFIDIS